MNGFMFAWIVFQVLGLAAGVYTWSANNGWIKLTGWNMFFGPAIGFWLLWMGGAFG